MKHIYTIIFLLTVVSCNSPQTSIDKIESMYVDYNASAPIPIECIVFELEFEQSLNVKEITDHTFLSKIESRINSLNVSRSTNTKVPPDIRMKNIIFYKDGNIDTLCLGGYFDVVYNGQIMDDDEDLLELMKSKLYK